MFRYIRTWQDTKKFNEWGKQIRKKIGNERLQEHFDNDFSQMKNANEFTKASFVMYWEVQTDSRLGTIAPPLVQGTLISMTNRLIEQGKMDEVQVMNAIMINFTRIMGVINSGDNDEEE